MVSWSLSLNLDASPFIGLKLRTLQTVEEEHRVGCLLADLTPFSNLCGMSERWVVSAVRGVESVWGRQGVCQFDQRQLRPCRLKRGSARRLGSYLYGSTEERNHRRARHGMLFIPISAALWVYVELFRTLTADYEKIKEFRTLLVATVLPLVHTIAPNAAHLIKIMLI